VKRAALLLAALLIATSSARGAAAPPTKVVFGFPIAGSLGPLGILTPAVIRGPYKPVGNFVPVKDVVTSAHADDRTLSYTISRKAYWDWGGRKIPVTWRDFAFTLRTFDDASAGFQPAPGLGNLDPNRIGHSGLRQVTFYWRTSGCTDETPCGPFTNWVSLFNPLLPSFALANPNASTLWQNCVCGDDGKPISDGPFYLARYSPADNVAVLKPNPFWGGHKPALHEVDLRSAIDYADALRAGALDAYADRADNSVEPLLHMPGITVQWGSDPVLELLLFRLGGEKGGPGVTKGASNALLRAPWMRQAIALAIDRRAIVANLFGNFARVTPSADNLLVYPFGAGYHADFARWNYNPARALSLLKAHCVAGTGPTAPDPSNTKTWQCADLPAIFRWTWKAESTARTTTEELAKADLRAVGIQLVERPLPANVIYTANGAASGDFDILDLSVSTTGDPSDFFDLYRCGGASNWTGFCGTKVDALLKAASANLDPGQRIESYAAADRLLAQSLPAFPLYVPMHALVRKTSLLGIDPGVPFSTIEDWHWKR
jgi:ABC-type transport system substrate-binding protein